MSLEGAIFKLIKKVCVEADLFLCLASTHLGCPACCALPGGHPELASLGEVLALLQQLLPDVARDQGAAVLINPMTKVLASHTNT